MFTIIGGDGREYGPASAEQIRQWIAAGRANLDTRAKQAGSDEWKPLAEFPEIVASPSLEPPPLAGAPALPALHLASLTARLGAAIVDNLILSFCLMPFAQTLGFDNFRNFIQTPDQTNSWYDPHNAAGVVAAGACSILLILCLAIAQITLLSLRGQTIGKLVARVRIVKHPAGGHAGFVRAVLLRYGVVYAAMMLINRLLPGIGTVLRLVDIFFIFRSDRRCLHDQIAGTIVVRA